MQNKATKISSAVAVLAVLFSAPALADDYPAEITFKLERGLANASLGWVELFKNAYNEPADKGPMYIPVGLVAGVYHTVGRSLVGVFDTASFLIPTEPLVHPTYVWEDFYHGTSYGVR